MLSHAQTFDLTVAMMGGLSLPLTIAGGTIAIFPDKAWKTEHRPSWPGLILLLVAWIPWSIPASLLMPIGALFLSPIRLPLSKTARVVAEAITIVLGIAFLLVRLSRI